jgi:3-oxoacyl-[acyl-carrier protein] reductase
MVAIADVDADAAGRLAQELQDRGTRAVPIVMDVRDDSTVQSGVASAAKALGGLDVLVNNAGIVRDRRLDEMTNEDWDLVLEIDLRGCFLVARAALPLLRESAAARIINISSRAYLGNPGQANYAAAKAGVIGLTRALSLELGPEGITVNAVAPGMIDTPLVRDHPKSEAIVARALKATPIKRLGTSEDVAAAVAFLASADAGYISGDVLHISGGRY